MSLEFRFRFVDQHRGPYSAFLARHEVAAAGAWAAGPAELKSFCSDLLTCVSDERNLMSAMQHLLLNGGTSPGPDGRRLIELGRMDRWSLVRALRDRLLSGTYVRGPMKKCRIKKRLGSSAKRTIWVANGEDRVVARGALQILEPLLDPVVSPLSFSWRHRGRLAALRYAVRQVEVEGRVIWITEDLRDAFDQVPRTRLFQILEHYVPNAAFCNLVEHLAARTQRRGILQGSAVSSALLDLYLGHFVHPRWQRDESHPPLLNYVDDLWIGCRPDEDTNALYRDLDACIRGAGMRPKLGPEQAIADLRDQAVTWLGYRLRLLRGQLQIRSARFAPTSPDRRREKHQLLVAKFARLHDRPAGWRDANSVVRGLVADLAPTLPFEDPRRIYDWIAKAAAEAGFQEIWSFDETLEYWQVVHQRWLKSLVVPPTVESLVEGSAE